MKKIKNIALVLVVSLAVIVITGCESQAQKQENIMKEYATAYFNNHMIGIQPQAPAQITVIEVSIDMLKQVNELKGEEQYDISKLYGCKGSSHVDLTIDTENQNIQNYEFHLECE